MAELDRRRRWMTAAAIALAVHGCVAWRACRSKTLPLHTRARGTPTPTFMHMTVVESASKGAPVAAATPFAPKERFFGEDELLLEPERPRMGLWLLRSRPLSMQLRASTATLMPDAGPFREVE